MSDYIYELRDTTDEERYFLLGIFKSVADIKKAIATYDTSGEALTEAGSDGDVDYETLSICKLRFGTILGDGWGYTCMTIDREQHYDEATDEYRWKTTSTKEGNNNA